MNKIDDITIMNAWMFPTVFADERNLKLTKQLNEIGAPKLDEVSRN